MSDYTKEELAFLTLIGQVASTDAASAEPVAKTKAQSATDTTTKAEE